MLIFTFSPTEAKSIAPSIALAAFSLWYSGIAEKNEILEKSTSNIATAKTLLVDYLNIKDLLKYETLVIMKDSLAKLETRV